MNTANLSSQLLGLASGRCRRLRSLFPLASPATIPMHILSKPVLKMNASSTLISQRYWVAWRERFIITVNQSSTLAISGASSVHFTQLCSEDPYLPHLHQYPLSCALSQTFCGQVPHFRITEAVKCLASRVWCLQYHYVYKWHQVNTDLILVVVTELSVAVTRGIRKVGDVVELWERNVQGKRSMTELIATHLEFLSCCYQRKHPLRMQLVRTTSNNGTVCTCVMKCFHIVCDSCFSLSPDCRVSQF